MRSITKGPKWTFDAGASTAVSKKGVRVGRLYY